MLVGNVVLKHVLGQGGMGSVWAAEHLNLRTEVAVKFLAPELSGVSEAGARFQWEAAAAAKLKSPHVVQIFDHGVSEQGLPYIVMELLRGEDLAKRIERLGTRPLVEVVSIIAQVARAVGTAHAQGIVHRDIKPENVFLIEQSGDLFVKLLDFGIAKNAQDLLSTRTSTGIMIGTPHFMSPEQLLSSKGVDFRSDLWSVAVVAYVALTGRLPFEGETIGSLCVAINAGNFEPVTHWRSDLPAALDTWFERAFQRDPAARFASAQELAQELELVSFGRASLASVRPVASSPPSAPVPQSRPNPETSFDASLTQPEAQQQRGVLTLLAVVLTSAFFSALTTVLVLAPDSFRALGSWGDNIRPSIQSNSRLPEPDASDEAWPVPKPKPSALSSVSTTVPEVVPAETDSEPEPATSTAPLPTSSPARKAPSASSSAPLPAHTSEPVSDEPAEADGAEEPDYGL